MMSILVAVAAVSVNGHSVVNSAVLAAAPMAIML